MAILTVYFSHPRNAPLTIPVLTMLVNICLNFVLYCDLLPVLVYCPNYNRYHSFRATIILTQALLV